MHVYMLSIHELLKEVTFRQWCAFGALQWMHSHTLTHVRTLTLVHTSSCIHTYLNANIHKYLHAGCRSRENMENCVLDGALRFIV